MDFSLSPFPPAPAESVENAITLVPIVFREHGKFQTRADGMAAAIGQQIKDKFAADQAIRRLIEDELLEWQPVQVHIPSVFDENGNCTFSGGNCGGAVLPESGPIPLRLILIKATDRLWDLKEASVPKGQDPERTADTPPDKKKNIREKPNDPQVVLLAKKINEQYDPKNPDKSKKTIAEDFTGGDAQEAQRLLRQLQPSRYGHLLK